MADAANEAIDGGIGNNRGQIAMGGKINDSAA
jgi:hypothetical protein